MASDLLNELFAFLKGRTFVVGDEQTIKAMTQSMQNPPMTMRNRVVMQMTVKDYQHLAKLLATIEQQLQADHAPIAD